MSVVIGVGIVAVILLFILVNAIRIVQEYERGVVFRLGRVIAAKGPGLFFIIPIVDRMVVVSLRTVTMDIPPQDIITKDNVTIRVSAVTYFNVMDPIKAIVAIENYLRHVPDRPDDAAQRRGSAGPRLAAGQPR